jgi:ubiquitin carboxyl-terminal hydrolase 5/13
MIIVDTHILLVIPVEIPQEIISFESMRGHGPREDEQLLPDTDEKNDTPKVDREALEQLMSMGFPEIRCKKALLATNQQVESALNWLFEHNDDSGKSIHHLMFTFLLI